MQTFGKNLNRTQQAEEVRVTGRTQRGEDGFGGVLETLHVCACTMVVVCTMHLTLPVCRLLLPLKVFLLTWFALLELNTSVSTPAIELEIRVPPAGLAAAPAS